VITYTDFPSTNPFVVSIEPPTGIRVTHTALATHQPTALAYSGGDPTFTAPSGAKLEGFIHVVPFP